jgi:hypothetical protein
MATVLSEKITENDLLTPIEKKEKSYSITDSVVESVSESISESVSDSIITSGSEEKPKTENKYIMLERRAVTIKNKIECKQDLIIKRLQTFYAKPGYIEILVPIIKGESDISLRLVDYFVTNYAKKNNTNYIHKERQFLVYFHYKRELKANSKRLFDPFCRRERILFQINGIEPFITTVGQLNFFSWAIERGIIDYITENRITIENDMNRTLKEHYSRSTHSSTTTSAKSPLKITPTSAESRSSDSTISHVSASSLTSEKTRRKRSELTTSAMKKVNIHECKTVISFD